MTNRGMNDFSPGTWKREIARRGDGDAVFRVRNFAKLAGKHTAKYKWLLTRLTV